MKQEGKIKARKGTKRVTVKLDSAMPNDKYSVTTSVINPVDLNPPIAMEVPFETKEIDEFVIVFPEKLEQSVDVVWIVEEFT